MTSKDFRTIIEYNNLQTIADDLQVTEQYKILLKGIEDGKPTIKKQAFSRILSGFFIILIF